jgi:ABC-2 type transport system ATP-binding protein
LISTGSVDEFISQSTDQFVRVRTPRATELGRLLLAQGIQGIQVTSEDDGALSVGGISAVEIGDLALAFGIALHELSPQMASLEDAFMELTRDAVEYHGTTGPERIEVVPQSLTSGK